MSRQATPAPQNPRDRAAAPCGIKFPISHHASWASLLIGRSVADAVGELTNRSNSAQMEVSSVQQGDGECIFLTAAMPGRVRCRRARAAIEEFSKTCAWILALPMALRPSSSRD